MDSDDVLLMLAIAGLAVLAAVLIINYGGATHIVETHTVRSIFPPMSMGFTYGSPVIFSDDPNTEYYAMDLSVSSQIKEGLTYKVRIGRSLMGRPTIETVICEEVGWKYAEEVVPPCPVGYVCTRSVN